MGVVLSALLCMQGAIWAKPTWGVWWDWDPRLTTTAVLVFAFGGILALRQFVDDPVKRATWSAVATIIAYVDVPIVYFSVKWWNSLHQLQSSPGDGLARLPLAAAHQRLRHAVPDVGAHRAARARGRPAARGGAGAAAARGGAAARGQRGRSRPMTGVIQGGWEFVWAAYAVTAAILTGYAVSVIARYRASAAPPTGT